MQTINKSKNKKVKIDQNFCEKKPYDPSFVLIGTSPLSALPIPAMPTHIGIFFPQ
jgi:hypothetical protein